ncbi:hypothetical protein ACTFIR_000446 [Dictyostelium discoideum]
MDFNNFSNDYFDAGTNVGGINIEDTKNVKCLFRGITNEVINLIGNSKKGDFIFFCIAWFTNTDILNKVKLAKNTGVRILIVILKEPWLTESDWLIDSYTILNNINELERNDYLKIFRDYGIDFCQKEEIVDWNSLQFDDDVIRVCGEIQTKPNQYIPRMHNKFIVFGSFESGKVEPKTVWTGSFNLTKTAGKSFENVVILSSKEAASQFLKEFCLVFFLSEPLETKNKKMTPNIKYNSFKEKDYVLVKTSQYVEDVDEDTKIFWLKSKIIKIGTVYATVEHVNGFKEKIPFRDIQNSNLKLVQSYKDFNIDLIYIIMGKGIGRSGKLLKKTKEGIEIILTFELVHDKNKIINKKFSGTINNIFLSKEIY